MKQGQRHREEPLQRAALACVEKRRGVCIGQRRVAPVFIPREQLGQRVRALHGVACVVEECGVALP
jgi:hypothetical protein